MTDICGVAYERLIRAERAASKSATQAVSVASGCKRVEQTFKKYKRLLAGIETVRQGRECAVKKLRRDLYNIERRDCKGEQIVVQLPMEIIRLILAFYFRLGEDHPLIEAIYSGAPCFHMLVPPSCLRAHLIDTWLSRVATRSNLLKLRRPCRQTGDSSLCQNTRTRSVSAIPKINRIRAIVMENRRDPRDRVVKRVKWKQDCVSASDWLTLRALAIKNNILASFRYTYRHHRVEITFFGPVGVLEFRCPDAARVAGLLDAKDATWFKKKELKLFEGGFCVPYSANVPNTKMYLGRVGTVPIVPD